MKKNNRVKIYVATHKPGAVRHDGVYTPIHVGRAISNYKDEMADNAQSKSTYGISH